MNSGKKYTINLFIPITMNIRNIYTYIFLLEKRIPTISRWFEEITRLFTCFKRHVIIDTIVPPISCNRSKSHYGITYLCGNFEKSVPFIHWQFLESTNTRWNTIERRKRPRRPRGTHSIHRTNPIASHTRADTVLHIRVIVARNEILSLLEKRLRVRNKNFLAKRRKEEKREKRPVLEEKQNALKKGKKSWRKKRKKKKWQTKEQEKEKENEIRGGKEEETKQERDTFGAVLHSFSRWWKRRANLENKGERKSA